MKRSTTLALASAAGAVAIVAYTSSGSKPETDTVSDIYTSVQDCVNSGKQEALCQARFAEANDKYKRSAPRFEFKHDCEKEFGLEACVPDAASGTSVQKPASGDVAAASLSNTASASSSSGSSYFMPALMGYMIGRAMQNNGQAAAPLYGCGQGMRAAANGTCYSSNSGRSFYAAAAATGGGRSVQTPVSEFRAASNNRYKVVPYGGSFRNAEVSSRGGFGASGKSAATLYAGG